MLSDLKMEDSQFRDKSNALLDMPCRNTVDVQSMLQVLTENVDLETLKARVVNPLTGIKVACYYGCIMNRPPELMKFDHHENLMAMDNLMAALGAEVVPFPLKVECCGASFGIPRRDIVMRLSGKLLDSARGFGADDRLPQRFRPNQSNGCLWSKRRKNTYKFCHKRQYR